MKKVLSMKHKIMVKDKRNKYLGMRVKNDQNFRVKLQQQLKKKYRFATGGSGRRFFLALFALRQLRSHGGRRACRKTTKKRNGGWTITVTSPAVDSHPEDHSETEEEDVEENASVVELKSNFSMNEDDSHLAIPSGYSCPLEMELAQLDKLDRQQPQPTFSQQVLGVSYEGIRLPVVVYSLLMKKHFEQSSCVALALSGAFCGFSSLYSSSRQRSGLVINEQCFYFTPTTFSTFIDQYIPVLSITVLNLNNLYWLPAKLLESTIMKMTNIENLSIKGTRVCTVRQVAKILQSCPNIKSLDFTFTEKTEGDIEDGLKKENISIDSLTKSFQKLTSLKLSTTTVPYPQYLTKDPWLPILKILRCCRDCTSLTIEVTYPPPTVDVDTYWKAYQRLRAEGHAIENWHQLKWMLSLESLVILTKLGSSDERLNNGFVVAPLLDDLLCNHLFPYRATPIIPARPMKCLWIEGFVICSTNSLEDFDPLNYLSPECLTSLKNDNMYFTESPEYVEEDSDDGDDGDDDDDGPDDVEDDDTLLARFHQIENFGGMMDLSFKHPLPTLQKLKFASGIAFDNRPFYKFCRAHPDLEHLTILRFFTTRYHLRNVLFKLTKLKSFSCKRPFIKEFVEAMTKAYPNLETLKLTTYRIHNNNDYVLSALCFPKLTYLSLSNFQLGRGSFLLKVIEKSPKLEILHLETASLEPASFLANLKSFLGQATKLRDFRLKWKHQDEEYPDIVLSFLKVILKESVQLERIALIDDAYGNSLFSNHPPDVVDSLVNFAAKMTHLTCCCLTFKQMDVGLMKAIENRVEEEVVTERPSLWFHLGCVVPKPSDPGVPPIHYHQLVEPTSFDMPRF